LSSYRLPVPELFGFAVLLFEDCVGMIYDFGSEEFW
jgi:hypothetical protein